MAHQSPLPIAVLLLILSAASVSAQDNTQSARSGLNTSLPTNVASGFQTNPILAPPNTTPMKRLETRISNRVRSRIYNRIEHVQEMRTKTSQTQAQAPR